jgi:hypothetical protein
MKDAGAITASAQAQVGGVDKILDVGTGYVDADIVVDVTAMDVASGDEKYEIELQLSNSATFASGNVVKTVLKLGDSTVNGASADSVIGRYVMCFNNEFNGTVYRYARLYTRVAGTTPSINYSAYVGKDA